MSKEEQHNTALNRAEHIFCSNCGHEIAKAEENVEQTMECPKCGATADEDAKFCEKCGAEIAA